MREKGEEDKTKCGNGRGVTSSGKTSSNFLTIRARHARGRALPQHLTRHPPRGHGRMELQDANWERFCQYHIGDWYGLWTPYAVDGVALTPRRCIRSFQRTADGRTITHHNHSRYADGREETKTFGPYTPTTTRGVFVEASFSWGSPAVAAGTAFAFESGFRAV